MATKKKDAVLSVLHSPSSAPIIPCGSQGKHVGADSLEMDTRKELKDTDLLRLN